MTMSWVKEFKEFINKGNVIDLAVAVVMGSAFDKIVKVIVSGLIMPIVGVILPSAGWEKWRIWKFQAGAVLEACLNFLVISLVIFFMLKKFLHYKKKDPAPPPPPDDVLLLREIRDLLRAQQGLPAQPPQPPQR
jgi:large conductance mechanosensitive channel